MSATNKSEETISKVSEIVKQRRCIRFESHSLSYIPSNLNTLPTLLHSEIQIIREHIMGSLSPHTFSIFNPREILQLNQIYSETIKRDSSVPLDEFEIAKLLLLPSYSHCITKSIPWIHNSMDIDSSIIHLLSQILTQDLLYIPEPQHSHPHNQQPNIFGTNFTYGVLLGNSLTHLQINSELNRIYEYKLLFVVMFKAIDPSKAINFLITREEILDINKEIMLEERNYYKKEMGNSKNIKMEILEDIGREIEKARERVSGNCEMLNKVIHKRKGNKEIEHRKYIEDNSIRTRDADIFKHRPIISTINTSQNEYPLLPSINPLSRSYEELFSTLQKSRSTSPVKNLAHFSTLSPIPVFSPHNIIPLSPPLSPSHISTFFSNLNLINFTSWRSMQDKVIEIDKLNHNYLCKTGENKLCIGGIYNNGLVQISELGADGERVAIYIGKLLLRESERFMQMLRVTAPQEYEMLGDIVTNIIINSGCSEILKHKIFTQLLREFMLLNTQYIVNVWNKSLKGHTVHKPPNNININTNTNIKVNRENVYGYILQKLYLYMSGMKNYYEKLLEETKNMLSNNQQYFQNLNTREEVLRFGVLGALPENNIYTNPTSLTFLFTTLRDLISDIISKYTNPITTSTLKDRQLYALMVLVYLELFFDVGIGNLEGVDWRIINILEGGVEMIVAYIHRGMELSLLSGESAQIDYYFVIDRANLFVGGILQEGEGIMTRNNIWVPIQNTTTNTNTYYKDNKYIPITNTKSPLFDNLILVRLNELGILHNLALRYVHGHILHLEENDSDRIFWIEIYFGLCDYIVPDISHKYIIIDLDTNKNTNTNISVNYKQGEYDLTTSTGRIHKQSTPQIKANHPKTLYEFIEEYEESINQELNINIPDSDKISLNVSQRIRNKICSRKNKCRIDNKLENILSFGEGEVNLWGGMIHNLKGVLDGDLGVLVGFGREVLQQLEGCQGDLELWNAFNLSLCNTYAYIIRQIDHT